VLASDVLERWAFPPQQPQRDGPAAWPIATDRVAACPALKRLLDVRRVVGLRNPAHSLVKLMNPCAGPAVVVGSYTHPEYAVSMAAVLS
jgi:hypothetical protein